MKNIAFPLFASTALLALAACGSSDDASEDAAADNVEVPADSAMADAPLPTDDPDALTDSADDAATDPEMDAMEAAEQAEAEVNADVEAAINDAEAEME